jgi:hypothetical protein
MLLMNFIAADCNLKEFQEANIDNQEHIGLTQIPYFSYE